MRVNRWMRLMGAAVLAAVAVMFVSGCDNGSSKKSGGSSGGVNSVVGSWSIGDSGGATIWTFNADGTFSSGAIGGKFSQDGDHVTGTFTNGSVGDGVIDATLSADGKSMQMDFIEYWHTPAKHNPLTGTKQ